MLEITTSTATALTPEQVIQVGAINHMAGTRMWGSYLRRALAEGEKRA